MNSPIKPARKTCGLHPLRCIRGLTVFFSLFSSCFAVEPRTWTDSTGRKASGKLISANETKAIIHFDGLKNSTELPLTKLSESDQAYIKEWMANDGQTDDEASDIEYDPNASYSERRETLTKIGESIPDNFEDSWPKLVEAVGPVTVSLSTKEKKEEDAGFFIYESDHYEFVCDVELKSHLVERFANLFESTREFCRQIPISTKKAHIAGKTYKNRILLFESKETYVARGGPPSSAGVYMPMKDVVMVPLTSLGVKKVGSSYSIDYKEQNSTLPHELAHQLTDECYYAKGAVGWFSEGFAEYVATTPYRSGKFMVTKALRAIKDYVTEYGRDNNGGRGLGETINAPSLKNFMLQPYSSFAGRFANFNYGVAALLVAYFFEIEDNGARTSIIPFMKALHEGKEGEEALEVLLNGRSYDELATEISRGWKTRGITINFKPTERE